MYTYYHKERKRIPGILTLLFLISVATFGQGERKFIRQGNNKFSNGKYSESEVLYRKAIDKNNMSPDASFNLGDALYKQDKYKDAGTLFNDNANSTIDKRKKSNNYYNLGNSFLQDKKLEESIEAYKNSLRLNPGNMEAKYNLAYAQDLLKKQQQQQQQQKNKGNNKDQDKKDQNKDQNNSKENQQQQQQQQQQQKQEQNQNNPEQQQQQQQQPKQQQQTISKEDAQRLLDALANDEKNVQEKVKQEKAAKTRVRTLINW
jgi:tetratricopeptide (TPR) repeat protein